MTDVKKLTEIQQDGTDIQFYPQTSAEAIIGLNDTINKHVSEINVGVITVNGKSGDVTLASEDVGALPKDGKATAANKADTATTAGSATEANHAKTADNATTADSAKSATTATTAGSADKATEANHAKFADNATMAGSATEAGHAKTADSATSAGSAAKAVEADHAKAADNATTAGTATEAGHAKSADSAAKLSKPVTINGISFDGSTNLSIPTGTSPVLATSDSDGLLSKEDFYKLSSMEVFKIKKTALILGSGLITPIT